VKSFIAGLHRLCSPGDERPRTAHGNPQPPERERRWRLRLPRLRAGVPARRRSLYPCDGFNARSYRTILQPLARDFRVLAIDLRGHGRTTAPARTEGRKTWRDLGDDLIAFMDALDLGSVAPAGCARLRCSIL
jgi:pimeloyl-ACP methyl ester carboxylesterase